MLGTRPRQRRQCLRDPAKGRLQYSLRVRHQHNVYTRDVTQIGLGGYIVFVRHYGISSAQESTKYNRQLNTPILLRTHIHLRSCIAPFNGQTRFKTLVNTSNNLATTSRTVSITQTHFLDMSKNRDSLFAGPKNSDLSDPTS